MTELPIYDITLEDYNYGIFGISLVKEPAIKSNFIKLSEDHEESMFVLADEDRRELLGALLIPDLNIYRKMNGQEFMIKFSSETIAKINERMQETSGNKAFTIQHELGVNSGIKFLESWVKETEEDKSKAFGIDAPIGSLFGKVKIESDLIWDLIKEGKLNGFSVELDAGMTKAILSEQTKINKMDFKSMYSNAITVEGKELLLNGELEKSSLLFHVETKDEKETLAPYSGTFKLENVEYTVTDGLVMDVKDINLSIEEKIEGVVSALNELKETMATSKDSAEDETLAEKLDVILTKMEENKLSISQKEDKKDDKEESVEMNFSVEGYNVVRDWSKKWKY